jgi:hypothetical protein
MDYKEAIEKSLTVKWKIGFCKAGEECWCREILPAEEILYLDGDFEYPYTIVHSGEMNKKHAEHFVKLHNKSLE